MMIKSRWFEDSTITPSPSTFINLLNSFRHLIKLWNLRCKQQVLVTKRQRQINSIQLKSSWKPTSLWPIDLPRQLQQSKSKHFVHSESTSKSTILLQSTRRKIERCISNPPSLGLTTIANIRKSLSWSRKYHLEVNPTIKGFKIKL